MIYPKVKPGDETKHACGTRNEKDTILTDLRPDLLYRADHAQRDYYQSVPKAHDDWEPQEQDAPPGAGRAKLPAKIFSGRMYALRHESKDIDQKHRLEKETFVHPQEPLGEIAHAAAIPPYAQGVHEKMTHRRHNQNHTLNRGFYERVSHIP